MTATATPAPHRLVCVACGQGYAPTAPEVAGHACATCGGLLDVVYERPAFVAAASPVGWAAGVGGVWRYRGALPAGPGAKVITLQEGNTRLHACTALAGSVGFDLVRVKTEGDNPTGSFKDRGMTVGVTRALERGARTVLCASTGNTSAALAAYAAKAGLACVVLIPAGKIASGKLAQAVIHGARVVQIRGNFDQGLDLAVRLARSRRDLYLLNSLNPYRLEGQKTLAYELYEQLGGRAPDTVIAPVGNAGNLSAIWKGFCELAELGLAPRRPRLIGIQAEGAAPVAAAFRAGRDTIEPVAAPETVATAIRIGAPVCAVKVLRALRESGGAAETVTDAEILAAQLRLAGLEGLFVEPGSAAALAGYVKLAARRAFRPDESVVCVATGAGLKDPDTAVRQGEPPVEIEPTLHALEDVLFGRTCC